MLPAHLPVRLKRAENERTVWREDIQPGIPLEVVMSSNYWIHVHDKITLKDIFEVSALDGSYFAMFDVVMKRPGELRFRLLSKWEDAENAQPIVTQPEDRFVVQFSDQFQHCVVERATGKRLAEGLSKKMANDECAKLNAAAAPKKAA